MKAIIYCRSFSHNIQEYYLNNEGVHIYLFSQADKKSSRDLFSKGVYIAEIFDFSKNYGFVVCKTKEKLQKILPTIERKYNIKLLARNKQKANRYLG